MRRGVVVLSVVPLLVAIGGCSSDGEPDPEDRDPAVSEVGTDIGTAANTAAGTVADAEATDDSGGGLTQIDGPAEVDDDAGASDSPTSDGG